MWQHHQIHARRGERQRICARAHARELVPAARERAATQMQGHAIGAQQIDAGQADLHRVIAEDVRQALIQRRLLPVEQVPPLRGLQPFLEPED